MSLSLSSFLHAYVIRWFNDTTQRDQSTNQALPSPALQWHRGTVSPIHESVNIPSLITEATVTQQRRNSNEIAEV